MDVTLLVILIGVFVVALAWFLLRFGKALARAALVAGVLVAVIVVALAFLQNARATRQVATTATAASVGQTVASTGQTVTVIVASLVIGFLVFALLAAVAVIGFLVVREKLNQRRLPRRKMGRQDAGGPPQVIYVAEDEGAFNLASIDLKKWGF